MSRTYASLGGFYGQIKTNLLPYDAYCIFSKNGNTKYCYYFHACFVVMDEAIEYAKSKKDKGEMVLVLHRKDNKLFYADIDSKQSTIITSGSGPDKKFLELYPKL